MNTDQLRQAWMAAREEALAAYRWWCDATTDERTSSSSVTTADAVSSHVDSMVRMSMGDKGDWDC